MKNSIESRHEECKQKKGRSYTTTNIPLSLMDLVDEVLKGGSHGYASRTDFIYDSIRKRLRKLGYLM